MKDLWVFKESHRVFLYISRWASQPNRLQTCRNHFCILLGKPNPHEIPAHLLGFALTSLCFAQGYSLSVEEYYVHPADSGELAGFTTYRVYLDCVNPTDFLSACGGDGDNPLNISSTSGTWYNAPFSSCTAGNINPILFDFLPEVEFDSFLTIGSDNSSEPAPSYVTGEEDICEEFIGSGALDESSFGNNFVVDDQIGFYWFHPFTIDVQHPAYAGDDLKVLILQITTEGHISGQVLTQIFSNGDQMQEARILLSFDSNPGGGCTDATACNFDPEATVDDGTCLQLDACGECGGPGIPEGDCDCEGNQLDAIGVCGGGCLCDGNANGICDVDEIVGCTYTFAENYNPLASFDDGSCTLPNSEEPGVWPRLRRQQRRRGGPGDLLGLLTEFGAECTPASAFTCGDPVSYQGYDYATVLIGDQCWFAENLRSTQYTNGDTIPSNVENGQWLASSEGARVVFGEGDLSCNSNFDGVDACDEAWAMNEFGQLYNGFAVLDARGLCPGGWHVPSDMEWMGLETILGMPEGVLELKGWRGTSQGAQLKSEQGWIAEGNGTNTSGFRGLPAGDLTNGVFVNGFSYGTWWSSTENSDDEAWKRFVGYDDNRVFRDAFTKFSSFSIRCIQDEP